MILKQFFLPLNSDQVQIFSGVTFTFVVYNHFYVFFQVQVKRKVSTNGKENNPSTSKLAKKDTTEKVSLDR